MYIPNTIDTKKITLSSEIMALSEVLARNTHEVWAAGRIKDGWTYGDLRDDINKNPPALFRMKNFLNLKKIMIGQFRLKR
jgi:ryanodine receptor 2